MIGAGLEVKTHLRVELGGVAVLDRVRLLLRQRLHPSEPAVRSAQNICKLAHAFQWERSCKRLKLIGCGWVGRLRTGDGSDDSRDDPRLRPAECRAGW